MQDHYLQRSNSLDPRRTVLAGRGTRLGAAFLDSLIFLLCLLPGSIIIFESESDMAKGFGIAFVLIGFLGLIIMQMLFLIQRGQSLGKMILGIKIVTVSDEAIPGFIKVILLRGMVPSLLCGIPYAGIAFWLADILCIFRDDRRCIHDLIAETKGVQGSKMQFTQSVEMKDDNFNNSPVIDKLNITEEESRSPNTEQFIDSARNYVEQLCRICEHFESSRGVCRKIHERVLDYPKYFKAKCNGDLFKKR
jgi:uncharacterized RDD family membrane protein YckC